MPYRADPLTRSAHPSPPARLALVSPGLGRGCQSDAQSPATRAARTTRPAPRSRPTWSSLSACTAPGPLYGPLLVREFSPHELQTHRSAPRAPREPAIVSQLRPIVPMADIREALLLGAEAPGTPSAAGIPGLGPVAQGARHRPVDLIQTAWDIYASLLRQDPNSPA
jgi:hypothetical protein